MIRKLFGKKNPLERVRRAVARECWADALALGGHLDLAALEAGQQSELKALLRTAGDRLATLNLDEGEAFERAGDTPRAAEHFALALEHAASEELRQRAATARERLATARKAAVSEPEDPASGPGAACGSSCGTAGARASDASPDFDPESRMELLLGGYPEGWRARYRQLEGPLLEAVLLAHEGQEETALERMSQVPDVWQDDLFHFERGRLRCRVGRHREGETDLSRALELNPDHVLALETLVRLALEAGDTATAETRTQSMLERGTARSLCLGLLALAANRRGDADTALQQGLAALEEGNGDPEVVLLTASLLESVGRLTEAEGLFARLGGGGGCGGAVNVFLAEFRLRHRQNLDQALEAFKAAARTDSGEPRWLLRIAQTYLAKGWRKEGVALLDRALAHPHLNSELRREGQALIETADG